MAFDVMCWTDSRKPLRKYEPCNGCAEIGVSLLVRLKMLHDKTRLVSYVRMIHRSRILDRVGIETYIPILLLYTYTILMLDYFITLFSFLFLYCPLWSWDEMTRHGGCAIIGKASTKQFRIPMAPLDCRCPAHPHS